MADSVLYEVEMEPGNPGDVRIYQVHIEPWVKYSHPSIGGSSFAAKATVDRRNADAVSEFDKCTILNSYGCVAFNVTDRGPGGYVGMFDDIAHWESFITEYLRGKILDVIS